MRVAHAPGMSGTVPRHRGLAIPTWITARLPRTCLDACRVTVLPKDAFEEYFLLLFHYPDRVPEENGYTRSWKTTHYSWLKQVWMHFITSYLCGTNFVPPQLTAKSNFSTYKSLYLFQRSVDFSHFVQYMYKTRIKIELCTETYIVLTTRKLNCYQILICVILWCFAL